MSWQIFVVIGVCLIAVAVMNRGAFGKVWESGRAQLGKFGSFVWNSDLGAIYQHRVDEAAGEVREATTGLETLKQQMRSVNRQVEDGKTACASLDARVKNALSKSVPDDTKAGQLLIQLKKEQDHLTKNQGQLDKYKISYDNEIKKIKFANEKIVTARQDGERLGAQVKMAKADAALSNLNNKLDLGTALGGIGEAADAMRSQIDGYLAKSDVAADTGADGMADIKEQEELEQQQAKDMLAEYKAKMGK
jgi:phage shock protein A